MIRAQLERGNGHHAYAWLLMKDGIFADETERLELIERYLSLSPKNYRFAIRFLNWGKNAVPERTRFFAKGLLDVEQQQHQVICTALNLLDREEAKPFARKLLEQDGQVADVVCTALSILDKEAEEYATTVSDNWQDKQFNAVLRCLNIAPASKQSKEIISFLLKNKKNQFEYFRILAFPFHSVPAWQEETKRIISQWKYTSRMTVADVLRHYFDAPFLLNKPCFEILSQWKYDIEYQRKKFPQNICPEHILIALGHPHLRVPAKRTAVGMLLHEQVHPGFLGEKLLQAAQAIVNDGKYPDWENESENN